MLLELRKEQQQTAALKKSSVAGTKEKKRTKRRTKDPLLDDFLTSSEEDDEIASDSGDDDAPKVINGRSQINKNDVDDEFALKLDESNSIIPSPTKRLRSQKIDKKACELGEKLK